MNNVLHADRAEQNGRGERVSEKFDGEVALRNVAQHAWDDSPTIESGEVGAGGAFAGGAAGNVIESLRCESFGGFLFEVRERDRSRELFS